MSYTCVPPYILCQSFPCPLLICCLSVFMSVTYSCLPVSCPSVPFSDNFPRVKRVVWRFSIQSTQLQTCVLLESGLGNLVLGVQTPEDGTTGGRSFCDWNSS
ncbi:hypothetical protein EYF80_003432 [Liparis tanakae]|uniref:Uncharacterized protein n=1 Tax=Liparis tanakae TaxID=230148 RepID=A0A4Z2J8K4_9TELE|nr:hypothetical protein EYF80_003432 [Liparis tanakae]